MVDLEKVRIMTKLAAFDKAEEDDSIKIARYYMGDYVRHELLKTLACITLGYVSICILGGLYKLEYLISNGTKINYSQLFAQLCTGYFILLIMYGIGVSLGSLYRYHKARKKIKEYDKNLHILRQLYRREQEREY